MSNRKSKRALAHATCQAESSNRAPLVIERSPRDNGASSEIVGDVAAHHDEDTTGTRSAPAPAAPTPTPVQERTPSDSVRAVSVPKKSSAPTKVERAHLTLSMVLQRAREYFQTTPLFGDNKKERSNIEKFFGKYGFFIKISHPSSAAVSPSDASAPPMPATPELGIFVINDDDTPISGIIVDALDNFKVLVTPLPDVVRDENVIKFCLGDLSNYDVYNALDGTRVTWYYVARLKTWFMATARSYDARAFKWIGPNTYVETFMECARPYVGADFSVESFDKNATYSFIFRHHDFHPLKKDPQGMWQLSGPVVTGIPQYMPIPAADVLSPPDMLRVQAQRAFGDYAHDGICNYGYILRRRDGNSPAAVYLESSLHEFVRKQIYDIPLSMYDIDLTNETRMTYLHLRGYMSFGMKHAHEVVFPDAKAVYDKMDFIVTLLTDITVAEMRFNKTADGARTESAKDQNREIVSHAQSVIGGNLFGSSWNSVQKVIINIGHVIAENISRAGTMSAFGDHIHANVRDQYMSIANMPDFMGILTIK